MLDVFIGFLKSKHFPIVVACILFVTSGLDMGMTTYVYHKNPQLFHNLESGWLCKEFCFTDLWWVSSLGYALTCVMIVLVSAGVSERNIILGKYYIHVRLTCLICAIFPLLCAFTWVYALDEYVWV